MFSSKLLSPGEQAPQFCLPEVDGTDKKEICTGSINGKYVVIYFYPEETVKGCTLLAKQFSQNAKRFELLETVVIGIRAGNPSRNIDLCNRYFLNADVFSEDNQEILKAFGVWKKSDILAGGHRGYKVEKATYLINRDGKILFVWKNVVEKDHVNEVLAKIREIERL
jgi:peroxiredoxin Q/BCP